VIALATALVTPAGANGAPIAGRLGVVVSDNPVNWTPDVLDGQVNAIVQAGDLMIVGGSFSQVRQAGRSTVLSRRHLFAFDARTGAVDDDFAPDPDGPVTALAASPDGRSVFIGGRFERVAGSWRKNLAKVDISTGRTVSSFRVYEVSSLVEDLAVQGGRLFVSGSFTAVEGTKRAGLAALDLTSGAVDPDLDVVFSDSRQSGLTVKRIAVTPAGTRLVALGTFTRVDGYERPQIAVVDLTSNPARVADWHTDRYRPECSKAFPTYMRDVDISPDGSWFAVVTTGSRSTPTLCDTATRWNLTASGSNLQPVWVDYTGGDTLTAVSVTDAAVYIGGHQRWLNNPFNHDTGWRATPGPGAVSRPGIAALDPANGLPLSWNPGREPRGGGVFALVPTAAGLWLGSDTEYLSGEHRARLALLPVKGGRPVPSAVSGRLPGRLYTVAPDGRRDLVGQSFDGWRVGSSAAVRSGTDWSRARGAFMISGKLYAGWEDGRLNVRSFDGKTFGSARDVDLHGLTPALFPVSRLTGMFFTEGRLYYTVEDDSRLYYRYFTPESGVVGTQTFVASGDGDGLDWREVRGLTLASGHIYWTSSDGGLERLDFTHGRPVAGTGERVSGHSSESRGMFVLSP
jgi:hypothetical protein